MAQGKKRAGNLKAKAKRERSFAKNKIAKEKRIKDQAAREAHNREVGSTGKQRNNTARKLEKALANSAEGNVTDLGDFTQYA